MTNLVSLMVAERGFEPPDLWVMSPTSYRTAPLRDIFIVQMYEILVPDTGLEPVREGNPTGF